MAKRSKKSEESQPATETKEPTVARTGTRQNHSYFSTERPDVETDPEGVRFAEPEAEKEEGEPEDE